MHDEQTGPVFAFGENSTKNTAMLMYMSIRAIGERPFRCAARARRKMTTAWNSRVT